MRNWLLAHFNNSGLLKAVFYVFVLALTVLTLGKYPGSAFSYLLFTLLFNALLAAGFREKRIFFDAFSGIFFWLGFWLKVSASLVFFGGKFGEPTGAFNFSGPAFDYALNLSSCAAAALLLASFARERMFSYAAAGSAAGLPAMEAFYARHKAGVWAAFMAAVLLLTGGNVYFGIYQKALPPVTVLPFGLSGLWTLALLFGLASVSAVLLNFEFRSNTSPYLWSFLALLECFLSNVSMLSRGMILNAAALLMGAFQTARGKGVKLAPFFTPVVLGIFFVLFACSVLTVNYVRGYIFEPAHAQTVNLPKKQQPPAPGVPAAAPAAEIARSPRLNSIFLRWETVFASTQVQPFINRWVGIEGVMSVSSYPGRGWNLWRLAWQERYSSTGTSMYDREIGGCDQYTKQDLEAKHFISLPGIVGFFLYPGSAVFLFCCLFALGLFGAGVELAVYKLAGENLVLCSLLGQVLAARYVHFGYVPRQTYLLLGGIFIAAGAVFLVNKALAWRVGRGGDPA